MQDNFNITQRDAVILKDLSKHIKELSQSPLMLERIKAWTNHNDLKPSRTMILLELGGLGPELKLLYDAFPQAGAFMKRECEGELAHEIETKLKRKCLEYMTTGDDTVIDAFYDIDWIVEIGNCGVEIKEERGFDSIGRNLGYRVVSSVSEISKVMDIVQPRAVSWDKEGSFKKKLFVEDILGDILDVRMRSQYWWTMGLTKDFFDLVGLESMMFGMIDEPETIHAIMNFLCNDILHVAQILENEGLFCPNTGNDYVGSGTRGFTSDLPQTGKRPDGGANLKDCWALLESQETVSVSPEMFAEFVWPYHKKIAKEFGLVYYGCCEPLEDRIDFIKSIPNLRSVSVSPWCNEVILAKECAGKYVYSRKPAPSAISAHTVDYAALSKDLENTIKIAGNCNLEIVMKDLHTVSGDIMRTKRWVDMARSVAGTTGY